MQRTRSPGRARIATLLSFRTGTPVRLWFIGVLLVWPCLAHTGESPEHDTSKAAIVRLAADHVDTVLEGVAASTGAIAGEFVKASGKAASMTPERREFWRGRRLQRGATTLFQTWPGKLDPPPAYQSDHVAWLSYQDSDFSTQDLRNLEIFATLTPAVRAAYHAYPYSWSYVTTADDWMMIYPFLTLGQAVNNDPPTRQTYYLKADFKRRQTGWTEPYLDLVGAGMMVTASTPAYDGDTLLGVVSHDVTLKELSATILRWVTRDIGGTAWLVDKNGLAIGVSDPKLAARLDASNRAAGAAAVHYRTATQLPASGTGSSQVSGSDLLNEVTDAVIDRMQQEPMNDVLHLERKHHDIYSARVPATGWYLVWMTPGIPE